MRSERAGLSRDGLSRGDGFGERCFGPTSGAGPSAADRIAAYSAAPTMSASRTTIS